MRISLGRREFIAGLGGVAAGGARAAGQPRAADRRALPGRRKRSCGAGTSTGYCRVRPPRPVALARRAGSGAKLRLLGPQASPC
jgi:hypothetical protein